MIDPIKQWIARSLVGAALALGASAYLGHATACVNVVAETIDVASGEVLHRQETHNRVVDVGLNLIKTAMATGTAAYPTHFAVGTGSTAVAAGDTLLVAETFRDTITTRVTHATNPEIVIHYYLGSGSANGATLAEAGLFTDSSGVPMYARVVLGSTIAKTISIAVAFTWTLTWGAL